MQDNQKTPNIFMNSKALYKNGAPWLPVMGEMQYSRTDERYWEDTLYKMKAGGIEIVSSYVMWNHHEEIRHKYIFSGNRNLREFVRLIQKLGLYMFLRVGPWIHGEARNGGFPDWLMDSGIPVRTNDTRYFALAEEYLRKIYEQVDGYMYADGGPIIGIQVENEYGHCGGLTGAEGEKHMRILTDMLQSIGFRAPIYTATGWGNSSTGGLAPVWGGYCEAPWEKHTRKLPPVPSYVFSSNMNDENIASDMKKGAGVQMPGNFPYLTAEIGGGMHVTYMRRPIVAAKDIGAIATVKLGSGANLLGFYVFCGGNNPKGILHSLEEFMNYAHPGYGSCVLPKLNYDFQAPIRQYGQIADSFKELKLIAMFLKDFGAQLTLMPTVFGKDNPNDAGDFTHLRSAVRHDGKSGYLFINNYQRQYPLPVHTVENYTVALAEETVAFPAFTVQDQDYFFYPFHFKIGDHMLKTALATPLCRLNDQYVFYADRDPHYDFSDPVAARQVITLTRTDALNAYKITLDQEYLFISDSLVMQSGRGLEMIGRTAPEFKVYPDLPFVPQGFVRVREQAGFAVYQKQIVPPRVQVKAEPVSKQADEVTYRIALTYTDMPQNAYLAVNYSGDTAELYLNGELVADHFYFGPAWEIGLQSLDFPQELLLKIKPLQSSAEVFLEQQPFFINGVAGGIDSLSILPEYRTKIICEESRNE